MKLTCLLTGYPQGIFSKKGLDKDVNADIIHIYINLILRFFYGA